MTAQVTSFTDFVDLSDRTDLFRVLDSQTVLDLSRQGEHDGFSSVSALIRSTGVEYRRILKRGIRAADVAIAAAERLQQQVGFAWSDCPAVGLCHSHADPVRAEQLLHCLASHVNIPVERIFAINHGCVGFLELVQRGRTAIAGAEAGRHVPLLNVETPDDWHDSSDKAFCGIVSSGATGTTLWNGPGHTLLDIDSRSVFIPPENRNDGEPLFHVTDGPIFTFDGQARYKSVMRMNSPAVFTNGLELMLDACFQSLEDLALFTGRIVVIPHQPSGKMLRALIATAANTAPDIEFLDNLRNYGNMISATIPTILARAGEVTAENHCDPLDTGDMIVLTAAGICMDRRADHLSQGRATLVWNPDAYRSQASRQSVTERQLSAA